MMSPDKCALIITSSVRVSARYTALIDPVERKTQYIDSISYYIRESPFIKIVVCDNSGHRYPQSLILLARSLNKELELLSFTGEHQLVERYGKGYGEGEIMEYSMANSRLLKEVDGFFKVTGRLKVTNIARLLVMSKTTENYFMPISLLRPRWLVARAARVCVEVRAYYATKAFFREVLLTAYKEVRDDQTFFLEQAYYRAMINAPKWSKRIHCFPVSPEITGMSGSNGWTFKEHSLPRQLLIRMGILLGYIRPIGKATAAADTGNAGNER
jgi:hypothetical protein